jgi:hypothetical protein
VVSRMAANQRGPLAEFPRTATWVGSGSVIACEFSVKPQSGLNRELAIAVYQLV